MNESESNQDQQARTGPCVLVSLGTIIWHISPGLRQGLRNKQFVRSYINNKCITFMYSPN